MPQASNYPRIKMKLLMGSEQAFWALIFPFIRVGLL
jgi:hypothetical protein